MLLTRPIVIRLTEEAYGRLEKMVSDSDCVTVGEAARKILANQKITILHRDVSMDAHMEELAGIRKELRHIGININQVTRHFHSSGDDRSKLIDAMRITDLYKKVDEKVESLMSIVSKLAKKWLQ